LSRTKARKPLGLESLPEEVRSSLLDIMHDYGIYDVEAGLVKMAILANSNSKPYKVLVVAEAERRYRSRHFTELNKAIATVQKDAATRAEVARNQGWSECFASYAIGYPCNVCGGLLYVKPNQEEHRLIVGLLREKGWGHVECHK
jgi:hypothetical protein